MEIKEPLVWACPICITNSNPYVLDPCGHCFCENCCEKQKMEFCRACGTKIYKVIETNGVLRNYMKASIQYDHPFRKRALEAMKNGEVTFKSRLEREIEEFLIHHRKETSIKIGHWGYDLSHPNLLAILIEYQNLFNDMFTLSWTEFSIILKRTV